MGVDVYRSVYLFFSPLMQWVLPLPASCCRAAAAAGAANNSPLLTLFSPLRLAGLIATSRR